MIAAVMHACLAIGYRSRYCLVHRIGAETSSRAVADRVQHTRAAEGEVIGQGGAFP